MLNEGIILARLKQVRDIVYGFIELDEQEQAIVNHPVFQRLRRIRQLAFTEMVYPGACHTRFEHSLGVMQMATYMYDHIMDNFEKPVQQSLDLKNKEFDIQKETFRKIVRLAALLHDVGHAPFSHTGEGLMPKQPNNERYNHENYSVETIKHFFKEIIENETLSQRLAIKVTDITALLSDDVSVHGQAMHLFLRQIISSQIDADRADYLLRDSIHLGVNYGHYDMHKLIDCLSVANINSGGEPAPNSLTLVIDKKGLYVAESLVIARYQMFNQVYFHKVRRIYDYHITEAMKEVLPEIGCTDKMLPPPTSIEAYMDLDDWVILGEIHKKQNGLHCKIIRERHHYKALYITNDPPTQEDEEKINKLQEQHPRGYLDSITKGYWYKPDKRIYIIDDGKVQQLEDVSRLVKALCTDPQKQTFYAQR